VTENSGIFARVQRQTTHVTPASAVVAIASKRMRSVVDSPALVATARNRRVTTPVCRSSRSSRFLHL
jgi:hypothetical protein